MLHIIILCCVVLLLPLLCALSAHSSLDERVVKTFNEAFARIYTGLCYNEGPTLHLQSLECYLVARQIQFPHSHTKKKQREKEAKEENCYTLNIIFLLFTHP